MDWPGWHRPRGEILTPQALVSGVHSSPGLAALCSELDRRPPRAILDLGASSTENLSFLKRYCGNVAVENLARRTAVVTTAAQPGPHPSAWRRLSGRRPGPPRLHPSPARPFRLPDVDAIAWPEDSRFDVVLVWDLVHYVEPAQLSRFVSCLARLCRDGALVLLIASSTAPITVAPLQFRIEGRDRLFYGVTGEPLLPAPRFTPRTVEKLMDGFRPIGFFQLRNGLQELLFRYRG